MSTHNPVEQRLVRAHHGELAVRLQGDPWRPAIVMNHSILSSGLMWEAQAALLAARGWHVVRIDTTGHGASPPPAAAAVTMDGLALDTVAVLDALGIAQAHYVGLSLGGMSGFGLALRHPGRVLSLVLCDARADAPPAVAAPWDERIALVQAQQTCAPLAASTIERWFGAAFVQANRALGQRFEEMASTTTVQGLVGCARAIQGLDYLARVAGIEAPVSLIVGANDGVLPEVMRDLHLRIANSVLETIPGAGHLPNIDQPEAFNAALLRHFERVA
jgi:3-oxoadipate enol-lactonase